jgi:hypothetical protein
MTTTLTVALVGAHFRPPAKLLLQHLPAGCELTLRAEPTNSYDPKAIQVVLRTSQIPEGQYEALQAELPSMGFSLEDVLGQFEWHLGYIADSDGKACAQSGLPGNREAAGATSGRLAFGPKGEPQIQIDFDAA